MNVDVSDGIAWVDLGDDDGFFRLSLNGQDIRCDAYKVNDELFDLEQELAGNPSGKLYDRIIKLMQDDLGVAGDVSHRMAQKFRDAVVAHVNGLAKKADAATGLPAESPTTTSSTPTAGP